MMNIETTKQTVLTDIFLLSCMLLYFVYERLLVFPQLTFNGSVSGLEMRLATIHLTEFMKLRLHLHTRVGQYVIYLL